jgi:hypothetical protein
MTAVLVVTTLVATGAGPASAQDNPRWSGGTYFPLYTELKAANGCVTFAFRDWTDLVGHWYASWMLIDRFGTTWWRSAPTPDAPGNMATAWSTLTPDGDLVVYTSRSSSGAYQQGWHSATNNRGSANAGTWLTVQQDGNVVLYDAAGQPVWATNTHWVC